MKLIESAIVSGIAVGGIYALIAVGITQIFKVTRVLNFAHAGFVLWGAYLYALWAPAPPAQKHMPALVAALLTILCTAMMGVVLDFIVFRIGKRATNVGKIIITFGVFNSMLAGAVWAFGQNPVGAVPIIPPGGTDIGGTQVAWFQIANLGLALAIVVGIGIFLRTTRLGLLTRATAEDGTMAELLGARRNRIGSFNWALAAGAGGLAGILVCNLGPFTNDLFLAYFTVALIATIVGGLQSLGLTMLGAVLIGVIYNVVGVKLTSLNANDAVLFAGVMLLILLRKRWPNELSKIAWTKPTILRDGAPVWPIFYERIFEVGGAWIALTIYAVMEVVWAQTGGQIIMYAVAAVSMIPILGWTGQVSLATGGIMGVSAYTFAEAQGHYHVPIIAALFLAMGVGCAFSAAVGVVTARLSFVLTAVVTLQFTNGMQWLLNSPAFHTVAGEISVLPPSWLNSALKQYVAFIVVGVLVMYLLNNLKKSMWGTRFLGTKTSPVMVQHFGVNPARLRVYAFAVSGVIAGLAGCLYSLQIGTIDVTDFGNGLSLVVLQYAVIGGVSAVWGPFIACIAFIGTPQLFNLARFGAIPWPQMLAGVGVVNVVSLTNDGITSFAKPPTHRVPGTKLGRALATKLHYMPVVVAFDMDGRVGQPAATNGSAGSDELVTTSAADSTT